MANINQNQLAAVTAAEFGAKFQSKREVSTTSSTLNSYPNIGLPLPSIRSRSLSSELRDSHGLAPERYRHGLTQIHQVR